MDTDAGIYVPWVDLEHTTSEMLVIEWVDGIRIDDVAALEATGHDIGKITEIAARCFSTRSFVTVFMPIAASGNIFIAADGTLVPLISVLWDNWTSPTDCFSHAF